ncbi:MAG: hypothetical protein WED04_13470 [Promethearchaeati archaeon SRVP18_Atabeyarchaeia-1]
MKKKEIKNIGRILALLGALVCLIWGILDIVSVAPHFAQFYVIPGLTSIILGILLIILSLVVFASYGFVDISLKFKVSWLMILIIGIVAYILGGDLGALLLILSAIVYLIAEL